MLEKRGYLVLLVTFTMHYVLAVLALPLSLVVIYFKTVWIVAESIEEYLGM